MANPLEKLIEIIVPLAPAVGTALGGPLVGGVLDILAKALGAPDSTPAAIEAAIKADPEVAKAAIARAEAEFKAAAEEAITLRSQIDAHVEMMRLDYARGWLYSGWRPLAGWASVLLAIIVPFLAVGLLLVGNASLIVHASTIIALASPLWAFGGLYTWGKTVERKALATGATDRIGALIKAVLGRK